MNFHLFVHLSCSLATRIEGEMTGLSFLSGKSFIPLLVSKSNLTFSQIISSNDNSLEIESKYHPTPHHYHSQLLQKNQIDLAKEKEGEKDPWPKKLNSWYQMVI